MIAIEAVDLTKRYGATAAVDAVSFSVEQGEIVGFLGPNGAGKTTTLRMLAGLVKPTSGRGSILGDRVPGPALANVGTMIEEPSFYPYLTGRSNLKHAALLHGNVPAERIDETLAFVHMQDAADKKVKAYSQGMRQRLALARALLWKPRVLLLDEPTNGLDPSGIAEVREALRRVAASGTTVLVSSHILAEIEKLVDRILAIDKGSLLFDGSLHNLLEQMGGKAIGYRIRAVDQAKLLEVLTSFGYQPSAVSDDSADVSIPQEEVETLFERLSGAGVRVLAAAPRGEDLEGAYLRLITPGGRPS